MHRPCTKRFSLVPYSRACQTARFVVGAVHFRGRDRPPWWEEEKVRDVEALAGSARVCNFLRSHYHHLLGRAQ